jgi:transcriptional regulator with XRE-family HTH domain
LDKILARQMKTSQQNIVDLYVGRRLKLLRNQKYISQKELAGRLGVTFQQIQKYEKGLNRLPASRMLAICFSLDITPNDLFRDLLSKEYPPKESVTYTDQEMELIETLRQLAPPLKIQVRKIVGTLASQ